MLGYAMQFIQHFSLIIVKNNIQHFLVETRAKSVDPRLLDSKGILCNRYAIDDLDREIEKEHRYSRARSMPRQHQRYSDIYTPIREVPQPRKYPSHEVISSEKEEFEMPSRRHYRRNGLPRYLEPPPIEDVEPETPVKKVKRREKGVLLIIIFLEILFCK